MFIGKLNSVILVGNSSNHVFIQYVLRKITAAGTVLSISQGK